MTDVGSSLRMSLKLIAVTGLWVLAACGGGLADDLVGRRFISIEAYDGGKERLLVADTSLRISFDHDSCGGSAGCNSFSAPSSIDGDILELGLGISTSQGCNPPALSAQETWYFDALHDRPSLHLDGDRLTLETDHVRIEYLDREVAIPDLALVGTTWSVTAYLDGKIAIGGDWDPTATMVLGPDGAANLFTGCNTGAGRYAVDGNTITFSDLEYTKSGCPSDDAQRLEDAWHRAVVTGVALTWELDEQRLTMRNKSYGLAFRGEN